MDPCIADSVLMTNAIPVFLKMPPARPDSLTGQAVAYKGTNSKFDVHLKNWDVHYLWKLPPGFVLIVDGPTIIVSITDSAQSGYVSIATWNDCGQSETVQKYVTVTNLVTLKDLGRSSEMVYPNPFQHVLNLSFGRDAKRPDRIEIYDATGRLLHLNSVENVHQQTLDFTGRPSGIYLLKLTYPDGYTLHKVLKL